MVKTTVKDNGFEGILLPGDGGVQYAFQFADAVGNIVCNVVDHFFATVYWRFPAADAILYAFFCCGAGC